MALSTFVKVGGVTNLSDARYCAGMGVHVLGFSLEETQPSYVSPEKYVAITEWLAGVQFAAEFDTYSPEQIKETLPAYPRVDFLQTSQPQHTKALQALGKPLIVRLDAQQYDEDMVALADIMRGCRNRAAYFLVEHSSLTPRPGLMNDLMALANQYPVLLGFALQPDQLPTLIQEHPLAGIALRGSEEVKPGYQNFDQLASILEAIEVEEAS
ncbi:MAG: phosphoribosylanthranilate isomerase [Tunicatimonas sp.]